MRALLFLGLALLVLSDAGAIPVRAAPGSGSRSTLVRGEIFEVASAAELQNAVERVNREGKPATVLLADGTYVLTAPLLHLDCPGLVIRGASGKREAVIVRGPDEGPDATASHIFLVSADNVVIADLTFGYCRYHGIQVQGERPHDVAGLQVSNCRLVNCNEQFIKGSSSDDDPVGATDGRIENCLFEFTSGWAYQFYTGGIDIHKGVNWVVRNNLFRNLRLRDAEGGLTEHAIHFWKRCPTQPQNLVVEQNWILNCDRGIGFGLSNAAGGLQGGASVIRNNFVFNDGSGPRTDVGIGLEAADGVRVENNTVVVQGYWAPIEYRFPTSTNLAFRNNLVNGPITRRDGAPVAILERNLERIGEGWFRDLAAGDLHLSPIATAAIDHGLTLAGFAEDIDGESRPKQRGWDIGADEF